MTYQSPTNSSQPTPSFPPAGSYQYSNMPYPVKPLKRTGPLVTLIVGIVALMIGVPTLVIPFVHGLGSLNITTFSTNETVTHSLKADNTHMLSGDINDDLQCTVTDPNGSKVSLETLNSPDSSNSAVYQFTSQVAGSYQLRCDSQTDDQVTFTSIPGGASMVGMSIAIVAGGALLFIGFILALMGLIWLINRNGKIKQQRLQYPGLL